MYASSPLRLSAWCPVGGRLRRFDTLRHMLDRPAITDAITAWYDENARDLPWRSTTPWGVMVSEFMLQQTPVSRVLPYWYTWMAKWPTPADLACAPASDAVREWGSLGYPRRAQRLHASAQIIVAEFDGIVPRSVDDLLSLPGIGEYTAAAISSFAYGETHPVLDTNVRRVLWRLELGEARPPGHITNPERDAAASWTAAARRPSRWAAAVMELGALVCTSTAPLCDACPVSEECAWQAAGYPESTFEVRTQAWEGTDRQCRGAILDLLRVTPSTSVTFIIESWHDASQARRCLDSLVADQLVTVTDGVVTL